MDIISEEDDGEDGCSEILCEETGGSIMNGERRPSKRGRSECNAEKDEELEWQEVPKKAKNRKERETIMYDIIIRSTQDKLPKQFAMAKLLLSLGLNNIEKVKYIGSYKIVLKITDLNMAEKILRCQELQTKGWNVYRSGDVNIIYGILRNVDLDIEDEEALKLISCPNNIKIQSFKRLLRRNEEGKWVPSESARIGFVSSQLPSHVFINMLQSKIEPFVFPVTQCSRCWRYGHNKMFCSAKKITCPKCAGSHENCETTNFKCVNCLGSHMALSKLCPMFLKERRIRELMAEFNCSYRVASRMYVRPEKECIDVRSTVNTPVQRDAALNSRNSFDCLELDHNEKTEHFYTPILTDFPPLRSKTAQKSPMPNRIDRSMEKSSSREHPSTSTSGCGASAGCSYAEAVSRTHNTQAQGEKYSGDNDQADNRNEFYTKELLTRLKDLLFLQQLSFIEKIRSGIKYILDWFLMTKAVYLSKMPVLQCIVEVLKSYLI